MTEHVLYRFFDDQARLLYVGITNNPQARFRQHRVTAPWWTKAAAITLTRFNSRQELAEAEIAAIKAERPKYNRAYAESAVDTMRVHERTQAAPLWPDASRFGNEAPPDQGPPRPLRLQAGWPCPVCSSHRVYKDATETAKAADDLVRCPDCLNIWLDDEWRAINLGMFDNVQDMSHSGREEVCPKPGKS